MNSSNFNIEFNYINGLDVVCEFGSFKRTYRCYFQKDKYGTYFGNPVNIIETKFRKDISLGEIFMENLKGI